MHASDQPIGFSETPYPLQRLAATQTGNSGLRCRRAPDTRKWLHNSFAKRQ